MANKNDPQYVVCRTGYLGQSRRLTLIYTYDNRVDARAYADKHNAPLKKNLGATWRDYAHFVVKQVKPGPIIRKK